MILPGSGEHVTSHPPGRRCVPDRCLKVSEVIQRHVTRELESLDRVYLNVYQPTLQTPRAVFHFLRDRYGQGAVSSHQMKEITERFLDSIDQFAEDSQIPIIGFESCRGERLM
jgi:hypothetical protein